MTVNTAKPTAAQRRRHSLEISSMSIETAIYTRQSDNQKDDESKGVIAVVRQWDDCVAMAELKRWTTSADLMFRDDDISATNGDTRPGFEALLVAIAEGRCQRVIVWHMDRLVRTMSDLMRIVLVGKKVGFTIVAVRSGSLDLSDPTGVALAQIITSISEMEGAHKAERQIRANLQRIEMGVAPLQRAFGYDKTGAIIETEAEAVRMIYTEFIRTGSLSGIAERLNMAGHRNTRGREWTRQSLRKLILNPRYIAKTAEADGPNVKVIVGDGNWKPIVDFETFDSARYIITGADRLKGDGVTARKHLGAGFYLCHVCNAPMVSANSGVPKGKAKPTAIRSYRCSASPNHCHRGAVPIDQYVLGAIAHKLKQSDAITRAVNDDREANQASELRTRRAQLIGALEILVAERAASLLTPGGEYTADAYVKRIADAGSAIARVDAELAVVAKSSALAALAGVADPGAMFMSDAMNIKMKLAVARAICTVTLLRAPTGRRPANFEIADTVRIDWLV